MVTIRTPGCAGWPPGPGELQSVPGPRGRFLPMTTWAGLRRTPSWMSPSPTVTAVTQAVSAPGRGPPAARPWLVRSRRSPSPGPPHAPPPMACPAPAPCGSRCAPAAGSGLGAQATRMGSAADGRESDREVSLCEFLMMTHKKGPRQWRGPFYLQFGHSVPFHHDLPVALEWSVRVPRLGAASTRVPRPGADHPFASDFASSQAAGGKSEAFAVLQTAQLWSASSPRLLPGNPAHPLGRFPTALGGGESSRG